MPPPRPMPAVGSVEVWVKEWRRSKSDLFIAGFTLSGLVGGSVAKYCIKKMSCVPCLRLGNVFQYKEFFGAHLLEIVFGFQWAE